MMALTAASKPIIFRIVTFSRKAINPITADIKTVETFIIANTVESVQPVDL